MKGVIIDDGDEAKRSISIDYDGRRCAIGNCGVVGGSDMKLDGRSQGRNDED